LFALDTEIGRINEALVEFARRHSAPRPHPEIRFVGDGDVLDAWRRHAVPRRFGRRLWVVPSGHTVEPDDAIILRLDPGLAFGTGEHPTTALCLAWLDAHAPVGAKVVDFGCGSGILAIAAALLGATRVLAIDHDPQALVATLKNAAANGVADRIDARADDALPSDVWGEQRVVIANILANPLVALAPRLTRLVAPRGQLVLSGLLEHQVGEVCAAYRDVRFDAPVVSDGWALVAGARRV
jgi:ribosomal protein L11 methyltransferase